MSKSYAVLPCNGMDKCAGCLTKEVAMLLTEKTDSEIICPVFYRVADAKYSKLAQEKDLLVVDGCATRCASKLAAEKGLKITEKINLSEEAKACSIELPKSLRYGDAEVAFAQSVVEKLTTEKVVIDQAEGGDFFPAELSYEEYKKEKFIFRVPINENFFFNENDVWVYVSGNKARIGVTDFVQHSLSDIMFYTHAAVGAEIEQFEEAGSIESGKAVYEIVCPVSGTITAINTKLVDTPEMINENPYMQGWVAEIELSDFENDRDMLHDFSGYMPVMKRKVDEFHV